MAFYRRLITEEMAPFHFLPWTSPFDLLRVFLRPLRLMDISVWCTLLGMSAFVYYLDFIGVARWRFCFFPVPLCILYVTARIDE